MRIRSMGGHFMIDHRSDVDRELNETVNIMSYNTYDFIETLKTFLSHYFGINIIDFKEDMDADKKFIENLNKMFNILTSIIGEVALQDRGRSSKRITKFCIEKSGISEIKKDIFLNLGLLESKGLREVKISTAIMDSDLWPSIYHRGFYESLGSLTIDDIKGKDFDTILKNSPETSSIRVSSVEDVNTLFARMTETDFLMDMTRTWESNISLRELSDTSVKSEDFRSKEDFAEEIEILNRAVALWKNVKSMYTDILYMLDVKKIEIGCPCFCEYTTALKKYITLITYMTLPYLVMIGNNKVKEYTTIALLQEAKYEIKSVLGI